MTYPRVPELFIHPCDPTDKQGAQHNNVYDALDDVVHDGKDGLFWLTKVNLLRTIHTEVSFFFNCDLQMANG